VFDVVGGDAFSGVTVLVSDPARIVSAVDPGVEEAGATFLVSTVSGTAPVAELITDGKVDRKILPTVASVPVRRVARVGWGDRDASRSHRSGRRLARMRMLHLGLRVTDLDRSLAFYTALGYTELGRVPDTPFGSLTMLQLPDDPFVSLELVHDPARPVTDTSAVNHLVVQTDDLDATIADLTARGVAAEPPTEPEPGLRTAWLTDPDSYRIELVQWPAGHAAGITVADMHGA